MAECKIRSEFICVRTRPKKLVYRSICAGVMWLGSAPSWGPAEPWSKDKSLLNCPQNEGFQERLPHSLQGKDGPGLQAQYSFVLFSFFVVPPQCKYELICETIFFHLKQAPSCEKWRDKPNNCKHFAYDAVIILLVTFAFFPVYRVWMLQKNGGNCLSRVESTCNRYLNGMHTAHGTPNMK